MLSMRRALAEATAPRRPARTRLERKGLPTGLEARVRPHPRREREAPTCGRLPPANRVWELLCAERRSARGMPSRGRGASVEEGEGAVGGLLGHRLVALVDGRHRQQDARPGPDRACAQPDTQSTPSQEGRTISVEETELRGKKRIINQNQICAAAAGSRRTRQEIITHPHIRPEEEPCKGNGIGRGNSRG